MTLPRQFKPSLNAVPCEAGAHRSGEGVKGTKGSVIPLAARGGGSAVSLGDETTDPLSGTSVGAHLHGQPHSVCARLIKSGIEGSDVIQAGVYEPTN